MCERVHSALDLVEKIASSCAPLQRIDYLRDDTDSYVVKLDPSDTTGRLPTKLDLFQYQLLPSGSQWVVGWRSFVALPFATREIHDGVVVGAEGCLPHPTRGAFPVFRGFYLRESQVSNVLEQIASEVAHGGREKRGTYGVINSSSATPDEHVPLEALMLRHAAAYYRHNESIVLRTALIAENELPTGMPSTFLGRSLNWFKDAPTLYLVASVPAIRARFSAKADTWLKAHEHMGSMQRTG